MKFKIIFTTNNIITIIFNIFGLDSIRSLSFSNVSILFFKSSKYIILFVTSFNSSSILTSLSAKIVVVDSKGVILFSILFILLSTSPILFISVSNLSTSSFMYVKPSDNAVCSCSISSVLA